MATIKSLLEESRRELLDLTMRNRLLSMSVGSNKSARAVHIFDEVSDFVFHRLVIEQKTMGFLPGVNKPQGLPELDASESEEALGEDEVGLPQPDEDAIDGKPVRRHVDSKLQTVLTSEGLQRRLLAIYRDAILSIEEQGVNILYLALGRLKWYEADQSETPRYAPLILIPVELERGSVSERFTLVWNEEETQHNISLAARLLNDFGIELPNFLEEEDFVPTRYADKVAATVSAHPRWEVQTNAITLGFFSFAKFLMYRDLDARNWPDPNSFLNNPALVGLVRDGFPASDVQIPDDEQLDEFIPVSRLDHVVDADSSQTVAIEKVRQGSSLVIQGPPGTGKSQSICNLIATAVLDGKKVLFVAEKLAALQVVKERLSKAGLGDLCLELHSKNSNKRAVLEEIGRTWKLGSPRGQEFENIVTPLEQLRTRLNDHVAMQHARLNPSGSTLYQILGVLAELGERGRDLGEYELSGAENWDLLGYRERKTLVDELSAWSKRMGSLADHPWRGTEREVVLNIDLPGIREILNRMNLDCLKLQSEINQTAKTLQLPLPSSLKQSELYGRVATHLARAPQFDRTAILNKVWLHDLDNLRSLVDSGKSLTLNVQFMTSVIGEQVVGQFCKEVFTVVKTKIDHLFKILPVLIDNSMAIAAALQIPQTKTIQQMEDLSRLASNITSAHAFDPASLSESVWSTDLETIRNIPENGLAFHQARQNLSSSVLDSAYTIDLRPTRSALAAHGDSIFRIFNRDYRTAIATLRGVMRKDIPGSNAGRLSLIDSIILAQEQLNKIRKNNQVGLLAFGNLWRGKDSNWIHLSEIFKWVDTAIQAGKYELLRSICADRIALQRLHELNSNFTSLQQEMSEALISLTQIIEFDCDVNGKQPIGNMDLLELTPRLEGWRQWMCKFIEALDANPSWDQLDNLIGWMNGEAIQNLDCRRIVGTSDHDAFLNRIQIPLKQSRLSAAYLAERETIGKSAFGSLWNGVTSDWPVLSKTFAWIELASHELTDIDHVELQKLYGNIDINVNYKLLSEQLSTQINATRITIEAFFRSVSLNVSKAFNCASIDEELPIAVLIERIRQWTENLEDLSTWCNWHLRTTKARKLDLGFLVDALESGRLKPLHANDVFARAYYSSLLRALANAHPTFALFDGIDHQRVIDEFRRADSDRLLLAKYRVLARHHMTLPSRHAGIGGTGILLGEMERKRGLRPVRKLLKEAGTAVQAIKPVFMMSPLSVAQYLEPDAIQFDLLVIDEASQVQPVDALGSFARAKQFVVVGDRKQLPPTRFFSRLTSDDESNVALELDDMQSAQAQDMESILGLCCARGMSEAMLRWHYRSRHHSLIAVSNHEFYEDKLFVVPSPSFTFDGQGLSLRYVQDGVYDRGKSGTNRIEARAICNAILDHAINSPELSLGVVAFSLRQQRAIEDEVELLKRNQPDVEIFSHSHPREPLFVKNLESVQGDERDVIFISVGYGPDESGYMAMNFGPLSNEGGERRLNVLISRAKHRCVVFTSLRSDNIDLARAKGRGVRAFKTFLDYAETGRLLQAERTDREEDSPFEVAVRRAIENLGYEVHPQVGLAGFFIDLAVVDPDKPGRYLIGIECDGATYHSSRSARDRDRLREAVLRDHGWNIHRIWSTDWFQRPDEQIRKVAVALEQAKISDSESDKNLPSRTDQPISIESAEPPIERDEISEEMEKTYHSLSKPYIEANFEVSRVLAPHKLTTDELAEVIIRVVQVEGPVHENEITARVRDLWGLERTSQRMQYFVNRAINSLVSSQRCLLEEACLVIPGTTLSIRNREGVRSASLRSPEMLPPQEIRTAIEAVVVAHCGASSKDVIIAVSRIFGFKTTGAILKICIDNQIENMKMKGNLLDQDGMLKIP